MAKSTSRPRADKRTAATGDQVPPHTPATTDAYRARLKLRMLQIAERILEQDGLAGLQARRIAKEADCSVGTLYNVFNGLDGLIIAANAQTLRAFGRAAEAAMRHVRNAPLEDQLMALAIAYFDFAVEHRRRLKAVFDHQMAETLDPTTPYMIDQARLFGLIEAPLSKHIADPTQRKNAARAMFAAVHGIVVMAIDQKLGAFDVAATEAQVAFIVRAMARGLPHVVDVVDISGNGPKP